MRILRAIWFHLRALLQPAKVNAEFDDELRFHIDRETRENRKRGMSAEEARRTALAQFGGVEQFKEELRDERELRWMDDLSADIRHGVRLLRKNMLFSGAVISTLALGIGATSTIFALVNGVLLRPLPYPHADRIVSLSESQKGNDRGGTGQVAFELWEQTAKSFKAISVYGGSSAVFTGQGEPIEITGSAATPPFFTVLGRGPAFGRAFTAEDAVEGAPRVVMLSQELWRTMFSADSAIINRTVIMSGRPRTVIGVMPAKFEFPAQSKFWIPLAIPHSPGAEYNFTVMARLRDGISETTAASELRGLVPRIDSLRNDYTRGGMPVVMTLHDRLFGSVQKPLTILLVAVVVLLLIACANVANLTLARSASRQREFAVRLALGAGRWRLVRQLLVESSILAFIGGSLGALVPLVLVRGFVKLSPASVAGVSDIGVDAPVLLFTGAISVVAALVFGLAPALTGSRSGTSAALGSSNTRNSSSRAQRTLRTALVVFEVSAALTLLTGAGLLSKSFAKAMSVNPGFTSSNVYSASMQLPSARYANDASHNTFYEQVAEQLRSVPGVEAVSLSGTRPMGGFSFTKKWSRTKDDPNKSDLAFSTVDAEYGRAAGLQLLRGRFLDASDVQGAPRAIMITQGAATMLFPGENAVGKTFLVDVDSADLGNPSVIVGVVADVAQFSLDAKAIPQIFLSSTQRFSSPQNIIIRTKLPSVVVRGALKDIVSRVDPLQPVSKFYVLSEELARSVAPRRFNSILVNAFAGLALMLAIIGLYGLMANSVNARTRELGIRMALGAQSVNVMRMVMKQGAALLFVGLAIGAALSLALSRTIASLLY
ncbi:MAG: ABC transporter permease, partial [Gemmatimonadaceae bacterium]